MSIRLVLGMLATLALTACIPYPTNRVNEGSRHNLSEQAVSFIEPGKTTRATVLLRLGEPDSLKPDESEYAYRITRILLSSVVGSVTGSGGGTMDLVSRTQYFVISFGKDGRVIAVKQKSQKNYFPGHGTPEEK